MVAPLGLIHLTSALKLGHAGCSLILRVSGTQCSATVLLDRRSYSGGATYLSDMCLDPP